MTTAERPADVCEDRRASLRPSKYSAPLPEWKQGSGVHSRSGRSELKNRGRVTGDRRNTEAVKRLCDA